MLSTINGRGAGAVAAMALSAVSFAGQSSREGEQDTSAEQAAPSALTESDSKPSQHPEVEEVPLSDESLNLSFNLSSQVVSRYVANGLVFYDKPSLQSNARFTAHTDHGDLFLNLWNHQPLAGGDGAFNEVDLNLGVSRSVGDFSLTLQHGSFFFPDSEISTLHQVSSRVDWLNEVVPASLTLKFNYPQTDLYVEAGVHKAIPLWENLTLTPSLRAGGAAMEGTLFEETGLTNLQGGIGLEWAPQGSRFKLFGNIDYLHSLSNDDDSGVTFGLGLRWDF